MKRAKIEAVIDNDVTTLLKSLEVYDSFCEGKEKCIICGDVVTFKNFQALVPNNGEIAFCCDKAECYMKLITEKE